MLPLGAPSGQEAAEVKPKHICTRYIASSCPISVFGLSSVRRPTCDFSVAFGANIVYLRLLTVNLSIFEEKYSFYWRFEADGE